MTFDLDPLTPAATAPPAADRPPFAFRAYQREDLARSAVHDGAIIAWDPGLGKTMAIYAWPWLKRSHATLVVAPADLHPQIISEGHSKFGVSVSVIRNQASAAALFEAGRLRNISHPQHPVNLSAATAAPEFFITDYRWLGYNGGDEWADPDEPTANDDLDTATDPTVRNVSDLIRRRRIAVIARYFGIAQDTTHVHALDRTAAAHIILGVPEDAPRSAIKAAYRNLARLTHPDLHPGDDSATSRMQNVNAAFAAMIRGDATEIVKGIDAEVSSAAETIAAYSAGIGVTQTFEDPDGATRIIRCVFSPTLSTMIADAFDCVVSDEAVRLKSGGTYIAAGVLGIRSRYRLALTGTPIKNRLPDIFFLASWVTGHEPMATARWPYGNTSASRASFANNHLCMEQNLTKEAKSRDAGNFRRYIKQTNRITNVHLLWKLLGPIVARRRKDEVGDDIVAKVVHPIRVQPGTAQQRTYSWHLANPPECKTPMAAIGAQLQCLRQAALCPSSTSLVRHGREFSASKSSWTPKLFAILNLAADVIAKGEQIVIFSPFQDFSTTLHRRFTEAGVASLLLDGRTANTKRGLLSQQFKQRQCPILIAGIDAMGEGHSFECAAHLCLPSLSWAYDKNRQAIERVHRLSSQKDVTIYLMITANSIDERLAAIFQEKGDSSDLALDGRLFEEEKEEVSLAELLRSAAIDFDPAAATISEGDLASEWTSTLSRKLAVAGAAFASRHRQHPPATTTTAAKPTIAKPPIAKPQPFALAFS